MCRMIAIRSRDAGVRTQLLSEFRYLANKSHSGPATLMSHRDGWGLVGVTERGLAYLGRAPQDASRDPDYPAAVAKAGRLQAGTVTIGHVRNASKGGLQLENTHPFLRDGWALCHNGTIHNLEPPAGAHPEGQTDSEALFMHLLGAVRRNRNVEEAIRETIDRIRAGHKYSSMTFLFTNGKDLYAYRGVGNAYGSCGTRECALEYYGLGYGNIGDTVVVHQEPLQHAAVQGFTALPDGGLLVLRAGEPPRVAEPATPMRA